MDHNELAATVQTLPKPSSEEKPQRPPRPAPELILTKQHRRFVEFCDAVRRDRYIARTYAHADSIQPYLTTRWHYTTKQQPPTPPSDLDSTRTAMWTPSVTMSPRQMTSQVAHAITDLHHAIEDFYRPEDGAALILISPLVNETWLRMSGRCLCRVILDSWRFWGTMSVSSPPSVRPCGA
jgi:hypothetical protein